MKPSQSLVDFIARHEGFRATAYRPLPTDRWTIGYGSTFIEDKPVVASQVISRDEALRALTMTLNKFAASLAEGLHISVTQEQFDAVVSLVYNIGVAAFKGSATGKLFYGGHDISNRFLLYNRSGGKVVQGLVNRRKEEREIYVNGNYGAVNIAS